MVEKLNHTKEIMRCREHWEPLFKDLGIPHAFFVAKKVMDGKFFWFFESQLRKSFDAGEDLYVEEIGDFYYTTLPERKLLVKRCVPNWQEIYEDFDLPTFKHKQYRIPYTEFTPVEPPRPKLQIPADFGSDILSPYESEPSYDIPEDCNYKDLTGKDWACIHLRVPKSSKNWLNRLIAESK